MSQPKYLIMTFKIAYNPPHRDAERTGTMIVCHCTGVTDRDIAELVADGATTVGEIIRRCGAGRSCGPCRAELEEMLDSACAACPARAAA